MSHTPSDDEGLSQADLLAFVTDPKNIKKAVEGSMEKRQALMDKSDDEGLREEIIDILDKYEVYMLNVLKRGKFHDELLALISQKVTEARIDELERVACTPFIKVQKYYLDRIATLTTKQDTKEKV
jgi:hypothetical protein